MRDYSIQKTNDVVTTQVENLIGAEKSCQYFVSHKLTRECVESPLVPQLLWDIFKIIIMTATIIRSCKKDSITLT